MAKMSPIPFRVPLADPRTGLIDRNWQQWFTALLDRIGGPGDVTPVDEIDASLSSETVTETRPFIAELQRELADLATMGHFDANAAAIEAQIQSLEDALMLEVFDPMPVPTPLTKDFMLEVAAGRIPGKGPENKFGRSTNVDNGVDTDIWDRANATDDQDIWIAPTAARTHQIVSTSASDDGSPAGVGARTLRIYGLTDWNTAEVTEDITLNGVSNVATVNQYVIIHRMEVLTKGSTASNVGVITATADTDATVTAQINAGEGQTQMVIYGVPSVQTAYMTQYYATVNKSAATGNASIKLLVNPEPDSELLNFIVKNTQAAVFSGTNPSPHLFRPYFKIPGPAIIKVQGNGDANNLDVSAGFDLILEDN